MAFLLDPGAVTQGIQGIQLAVAPVFLLTAVSGMIGAGAGRLGRIIERARQMEDQARVSSDAELLGPAAVELKELRSQGGGPTAATAVEIERFADPRSRANCRSWMHNL